MAISRIVLHRESDDAIVSIVSNFAALNRKYGVSSRSINSARRILREPAEGLARVAARIGKEADHGGTGAKNDHAGKLGPCNLYFSEEKLVESQLGDRNEAE